LSVPRTNTSSRPSASLPTDGRLDRIPPSPAQFGSWVWILATGPLRRKAGGIACPIPTCSHPAQVPVEARLASAVGAAIAITTSDDPTVNSTGNHRNHFPLLRVTAILLSATRHIVQP